MTRHEKLRKASDHEFQSARFARSGDECVEWLNPIDGHLVLRYRKQDPPLLKHKTGFIKALEHKIAAIELRHEVARADKHALTVKEEGPKAWGRAQRILYNTGYKRLADCWHGHA